MGKCMYICSKFQRKNNEVRIEELSPNTKLQISNNARSKNITLVWYMDRFKAFNILIHDLDIDSFYILLYINMVKILNILI